jgi:hypothetical protein
VEGRYCSTVTRQAARASDTERLLTLCCFDQMASTSSQSKPDLATQLKDILSRPEPLSLDNADLALVLSTFLVPTSKPRTLALALLARALNPSPTTTTLTSLRSTLESRLSGTGSNDLVTGLSALSAVLQVAPSLAVSYLKEGSIRTHLEEAVEFITSPMSKGKEKRGEEQLALVELLAFAAGQSGVRKLVRSSAGGWLESLLGEPGKGDGTKDARVRAMAGVGMVKLRLGTESPEEGGVGLGVPEEKTPTKWSLEDLTRMFVEVLVSSAPRSASDAKDRPASLGSTTDQILLASLEALAYLTLVPSLTIKPLVATSPFLVALLSILPPSSLSTPPSSSSGALDYAIATLLDHLTAFPPPANSESDAAQISRLKAFASAKQKMPTSPVVESTSSVTARITLVVSHSPLPTVRQLCLSPSLPTRRLAARILLSLVTPQSLRGTLLQAGVARLILSLIRQLPSPFAPTEDVAAIQALAKLLITTNPLLVLGPSSSSPLLIEGTNAVSIPLGHSEVVGLLCTFECLMALTNLASLDPELGERMAGMELKEGGGRKLMKVVEELMLSANTMVRRAATELMCNLVASEAGFDYYRPTTMTKKEKGPAPPPSSHLHLIIALASSPDLQTRLAASGALTSLAMEPSIALSIALYPRGLEILLALVEEEEAGLRHRAYDIFRSLSRGVGASNEVEWKEEARKVLEEAGVRKGLEKAVEGEKDAELREVAREALVALES